MSLSEIATSSVEQGICLQNYGERMAASGYKVSSGSQHTLWISHGRFAMQRQPVFASHGPTADEISDVFKRTRCLMLSFVVEPSDKYPANSRLYVCRDREYSLEKLGQSARSQVRRGLAEFELRFLDNRELLEQGSQAYCDTHRRTGLSGADAKTFYSLFKDPRLDRRYFGAFKAGRLAAFLLITEVEDWISIGGYSADEFLPFRPNHALIYKTVQHYVEERRFRIVNYGLSSVQSSSNEEGLERFKVKMGFESLPIHRAFIIHPRLRPFLNRTSWSVARFLLELSPRNMMLKKAEGALKMASSEYEL